MSYRKMGYSPTDLNSLPMGSLSTTTNFYRRENMNLSITVNLKIHSTPYPNKLARFATSGAEKNIDANQTSKVERRRPANERTRKGTT